MHHRRSPSRRQFLAALGATGVAGLAGCQDRFGDGTSGGSTPGGSTSGSGSDEEPGDGETLLGYDATVSHDETGWERYDEGWSAPTASPLETELTTERLVENMEIPWDLSFANDGTLFVTERVGRILEVEDGEVSPLAEPADAIDADSGDDSWLVTGGEGGTLGVAAHPGYPDPPLLYVYYTYEDGDETGNRVEVFDTSAADPNDARATVVDDIPGDTYHNGGRLTFGPANYLWITCGDALDEDLAPDRTSLGGKVLRVTPTGDPAPENPDPGDGADPRVFTYGHRNPQGITFLPDATPVSSEHGPTNRDELNRLVAGGNYGWPDTRDPAAYPDADDVRGPLANSGPDVSWAPSGATFYTGDEVPALTNRMLVGCLVGQQLLIATVTPDGEDLPPVDSGRRFDEDWTDPDYVTTVHTALEDELGRIRHVEQGPDGGLYAVTSNWDGRADGEFPTDRDDGLVRIVPAE